MTLLLRMEVPLGCCPGWAREARAGARGTLPRGLSGTGPRCEQVCGAGHIRLGRLRQERWGGAMMNQMTGLAAGVCRCPSKMPGGPRGEEVAKALWQMNG